MNFDIPQDMQDYLDELDQFIENTIKPLENENDNIRFFDHRREDARTDWERGGLPNEEWEALLGRGEAAWPMRSGSLPLSAFPKAYGGQDGTQSRAWLMIREHFRSTKGLGLHNDLQNEHSIVGNNVGPVCLMLEYGSEEQKAEWVDGSGARPKRVCLWDH